jgi:hypothetical protein
MTVIIFRFFEGAVKVYAVDPDYVEENTEPCTDIAMSFDDTGQFVTAKLVKRNQEQASDGV